MAISAALQGCLFYVAALCRWDALRDRIPAYVLFPILQGSTPLIVVLSAVLFSEWQTIRQPRIALGIIMSVTATYVLAEWHGPRKFFRRGIVLAVVAMFASAGATLAAKFAFVAGPSVNIFGFILVSNLTGLILSAGQSIATQEPIYVTARDCIWGVLLGGLNFCGLAAFLAAIQGGELSMVACIGALSLLVPILLSSIIQKERLNLRQQTALWLSFLSVLVLATASR